MTSETVNPFDPLVIAAVLAEESLRLEVVLLNKYRRKISVLLEERTLNHNQRAQLERLLEVVDYRNIKLYGE